MRPKNTYHVILLLSDNKNQIENDKKMMIHGFIFCQKTD